MMELMVVIAIVAILAAVAVPSFSTMFQNAQIGNAGDSIQNGLRLARMEAVRRNTGVQFALTSVAGGGVGSDWTISCAAPVGDLNGDGVADCPGAGTTPAAIQIRTAAEGSLNAVVAAGQTVIAFNGTGRVAPVPAADINIDISNPAGGACAAATGPVRCLRVVVSRAGQVRMCDPARASSDPRGC